MIEQIKLTFSSKNKFYNKKENSPTKYYRIRSKLAFFKNFLRSHLRKPKDCVRKWMNV